MTLWLTGFSGAGKSTLAHEVELRLIESGHACYTLDGDNVRHGLSSDLGFSERDRHENVRRVAEVAKLFNDAGMIVVVALISPYRSDRAVARALVGPDRFLEIHVCTALDVCEQRDRKGVYARARAGDLPGFTGISAPREPPVDPALALDSAALDVEACADRVIALIASRLC